MDEIKRWAKAEGIPVRHVEKGERKEAIAAPLQEAAAAEGGQGRVVMLGIATGRLAAPLRGIRRPR